MSFRRDISRTPGLANAHHDGLQALRALDRQKISTVDSRRLGGSADLDSALRLRFPSNPRWDYVVAMTVPTHDEHLHWIEVHPASGLHCVRELEAKLSWLKDWLSADGAMLSGYKRKFVWIASGRSAFQQNSPQLKRLGQAGLYFAGGHYKLSP